MRVLIPPQRTRQVTQILLNTPQNQSRTNLSLVRLSSTSSSQHASCEDQLRRKMLEKIIRVDHAGEMGASFIYQGISLPPIREFCLKSSFLKAPDLYFHFRSNGSFKEYKVARPHPGDVGSWKGTSCKVWGTVGGIPGQLQGLKNNFVTEMEMPNIKLFSLVRPTVLIPVWKLAGFTLGAGCSLLGEKGAMACTVAVGGDIFPPLEFCSSFVFLKILVAKERDSISLPRWRPWWRSTTATRWPRCWRTTPGWTRTW